LNPGGPATATSKEISDGCGKQRQLTQRLWAIAGRRATSGNVIGEPPLPVLGTVIYEVFEGGHFLVHHVDVTAGTEPVRAIEIIGEPDPATNGDLARAFDSDGSVGVMQLTIDDNGVFHFVGESDIAPAAQPRDGSTTRVRSTLTVAAGRLSMNALWERSEDGDTWQTWKHHVHSDLTAHTPDQSTPTRPVTNTRGGPMLMAKQWSRSAGQTRAKLVKKAASQ
jgi:hypothetical protein